MRAIVLSELMEPSELALGEAPTPPLQEDALRIAVHAAGCNFFDILQCRGQYQVKPPLPFIPGAEIAGEVLECGAAVQGFKPGDRVLAMPGIGGFAEQVVTPARGVYRVPDRMRFDEAAALPVTYPTSWLALMRRAPVREGEVLLVHAAAGGVGTAAVQIGKARGARVIGTVGGPDKVEAARRAGADLVIDYNKEDFVLRVREETGGRGADVIYDPVGGEVFDRSLKCIAWNGRLLVIGFAGGRIPELAVNRILLKNISLVGVNFGGHLQKQPELARAAFEGVLAMYERGEIAPLIYHRYPLAEAARALLDLESRKTWGKLVLEPALPTDGTGGRLTSEQA